MVNKLKKLNLPFSKKNKDCGISWRILRPNRETWQVMQITSLASLILAKLLRIRQAIDQDGKMLPSEGIETNLFDVINYSIVALIKSK